MLWAFAHNIILIGQGVNFNFHHNKLLLNISVHPFKIIYSDGCLELLRESTLVFTTAGPTNIQILPNSMAKKRGGSNEEKNQS
jgi:hypothetical protein